MKRKFMRFINGIPLRIKEVINSNKGFAMVEAVIIVAVAVVLIIALVPPLREGLLDFVSKMWGKALSIFDMVG